MKKKQEEQARQMKELQERAEQLQRENDHLQAQVQKRRDLDERDAQDSGPARHPTVSDKRKKPIALDDVDTPADDELSSSSSPNLSLVKSKSNKDRMRQRHSHRPAFSDSNGSFVAWRLEHIPRSSNRKADALAAVAVSLPIIETVLLPIYYQSELSITTNQVNEVEEAAPSWLTPIVRYLSSGELLNDKAEAHKIQVQATWFSLVNERLYKRSLGGPSYLKCLTQQQGQYILAKLHEGICGNHPGGRTVAHRAHTRGYYWPTMRANATAYVRKCDHYQRQAPVSRLLAQEPTTITSPWPFAQWGINIVGPFPTAPTQKKLLLVATDYFSKWIEAEAFASIKDKEVIQFVWRNIVCRFGIPQSIVRDSQN